LSLNNEKYIVKNYDYNYLSSFNIFYNFRVVKKTLEYVVER